MSFSVDDFDGGEEEGRTRRACAVDDLDDGEEDSATDKDKGVICSDGLVGISAIMVINLILIGKSISFLYLKRNQEKVKNADKLSQQSTVNFKQIEPWLNFFVNDRIILTLFKR